MALITVSYVIDIDVVVDTETGEIDRVVEVPESIRRGLSSDDLFPRGTSDQELDLARKIADEEDWPAWDFGY